MKRLVIAGGLVPARYAAGPEGAEDWAAAEVVVEGGRVTAMRAGEGQAGADMLDGAGCYVLPGFIDVHVHGAMGHDTMDADPAALAEMARFFASHGVTSFLPTTMTAPHADTLHAVQAVAEVAGRDTGGARILGVHLEGPYLSPVFPGAQLPEAIRTPNLAEYAELAAAGPVRMITLAPEQPGAAELIKAARRQGVTVVAGHTNATYEQLEEAVALGVTQATHTYNAMTGLHHRKPGVLGAVLSDDRVYAQLIADNVHVHPAAMKVLARCKRAEHTVLITDAMRAAGLPEGESELGGQRVTVRDGQCRLADGTLAGSVLTLDRGLANFMAAAGWSLAEAWPASSRAAAASLGLADGTGTLAVGAPGDCVLLDRASLKVVATVVGGRAVYLDDQARLRADVGDDHPARAGL